LGISVLCAGYIYYIFVFNDVKKLTQDQNPNIITQFQYNDMKIGGDFTLTDQHNKPFKFSSLYGKPTLMYFGFTHCPDFCPTSLQIMDAVSHDVNINRVFVSVDPKRDTVKTLATYLTQYKKGLIGLTGTLQETDTVAKQWYIYYSFNKKDDTDKEYTVDHTTYLYLIDPKGQLLAMIRPEATPQEIIDFIKNNLTTPKDG
jgi:protein SCO1/2